jgi:hypothetical protein
MYDLRRWVLLIEAAVRGGGSYWLNPQTGQIIPASDHGQAVIDDPDAFGIDYDVQEQMAEAFPDHDGPDDEHDGFSDASPEDFPAELWGGPTGWFANDAWEVLAMNRGWVRIGEATSMSSAYVSSATSEAVWAAVKFLFQNSGIEKVEIEIARPSNQIFTILVDADLKVFLRGGPKRADAFLLAHGKKLNESIDFSEYGYWVKPDGEALVVPDSSHYKVLLRQYQGDARFGQDQYQNVIKDGWCWVNISGSFMCMIEPSALTRHSIMTLQRIITEYRDYEDFRFVFNGPPAGPQEKRDFDNPMAARAFLRSPH